MSFSTRSALIPVDWIVNPEYQIDDAKSCVLSGLSFSGFSDR